MDDEIVIGILRDYQNELPIPEDEYTYFDEYTYSKWAAQEIEVYILSHYDLTPRQAILDFRDKMLARCEQTFRKNVRRGKCETYRMYSIAYDVATEILAILRSYI